MIEKEQPILAFIGRDVNLVWDAQKKEIINFTLKHTDPLKVNVAQSRHTLIIAESGGGKSYLAGVFAEELIKLMDNYGILMFDLMGIFFTLKYPNTTEEIKIWNEKAKLTEIKAEGIPNVEVWVPEGDKNKFRKYDHAFSIKARDFSVSTFCYVFDIDPMELMVVLYKEASERLFEENPEYSLLELIQYVQDHGEEMKYRQPTIDALQTRLKALAQMGLISNHGIELHDMIKPKRVVVLDFSMSSAYIKKTVFNFIMEKLLVVRKKIKRMVDEARVEETLLPKPAWYIPPMQIIIDEAHEIIPHNPNIRPCIKEGRNVKLTFTMITQSVDLTRDVYQNIAHLFVGPMNYEQEINAVKEMIPIERSPKEFRKDIRQLTNGCFWYFDRKEKLSKCIRVRARSTLHPASSEITDEMKYFLSDQDSKLLILIKDHEKGLAVKEIPKTLQRSLSRLQTAKLIQIIQQEDCTVVQLAH